MKIVDMLERMIAEQSADHGEVAWQWRNLVPFLDFGNIVSAQGATCEGILHYLPLTAQEMLAQPREIARRVVAGVEELKSRGALLVGLGGFTGIVGNRGLQTLEQTGIPVTTGNSLTAYAAFHNMLDAMAYLGVSPAGKRVVVAGYPGSIALVVARLLGQQGCELVLLHRGSEQQGQEALRYLPENLRHRAIITNSIDQSYGEVQFYVAATSSGGVIDPYRLAPGSVVVDAALPKDVMPYHGGRDDILLIDGGLICAGPGVKFGGESLGLSPKKFLNGCLAETMILGLEGRAEAFSIGRELAQDKVLEIGRLAERHGFSPHTMLAGGRRLGRADFQPLRRFHSPATAGADAARAGQAPAQAVRDEILHLFGRYINPMLREFYRFNHIERVFVEGKGCWLTEQNGQRYLDFVAGYGCLNTGHNHPEVNRALQHYLEQERPTFVQYVSVPYHTSLLARRLSELAPGRLERVFFSNSGTEAIEAGLKLAMAAMRRSRILYCDNGYHGKTLGALSVTGRAKHRKPFEPLLPRCDAIAFGDIAALELALQSGDVGAFILEPIQGEGGVQVPPAGYLRQVRQLCTQHDCILILDEIQTGLGRTGKMFCCEWDDVEPDIMVLAKSLSGGVVPIGATLSRADLWDRAYGSIDRFSLHTSTFGGGNFASAAALATLDTIERLQLPAHAERIGATLKAALQEAVAAYPFIREVRGRGLMLAIEFHNPFSGGVDAFVEEFANRMPGDARATYRMLSDQARYHLRETVAELENSFEEMFVMRFVRKLSEEHGILTFVTANSNKVLRIQPPLVLDEAQAQHFVQAFAKVCKDLSTFLD
ncbi:aminotransferase class III-fold pyridoxal phosphate-dependent enzyme [uncultured Herbaspirillum sp.]|uniref:aminotransferase class III-fold pyridoxal phosphate-dependent enzyme n=1 Tax=uncultured Herbaspirillum sp. TaxID=160236 RepID=UPI00258C571B|nr:aminotransferase class III-fold pyridoxal phosphate-dependent enzyme [uncultured Herbaspirillum sp.]